MPPPRDYDFESGKRRVSKAKPKKTRFRPAPLEVEDDEYPSSNSDLESELDMPVKDDSRRKPKSPPSAVVKGRKDGRSPAIKGEEDTGDYLKDDKEKETGSKVAPHMAILLAATYHVGLSSISRPAVSEFIPSAYNMFSMLDEMLTLLVHNSLLQEMCPEFFSPALSLYYAHVFYYQVLRARSAAGSDVLTRLEKRVLTFYERVGPAESWPIAAPLLGFLEYLGAHKTEDPMFGWIVPKLPNLSLLADATCLSNVHLVNGIGRVPLVPALQKLMYNYAHGTADFSLGLLRPVGQDTLDATHSFCGIQSSGSTNARFKSLAGNLAWMAPPETGDTFGMWDYLVKASRIRRWNVPDVPDNANLTTLPSFLGFTDNQSFDWMKHLLSMSAVTCRFFPGSGNLSQVSPLTTLGMATQTLYSRLPPVVATNDKWFYDREGLSFSTIGFTNTSTGLVDTKMSITPSWNSSYNVTTAKHVSVASDITLDPCRSGPFFNDDPAYPNTERKATPITENFDQIDPARRFLELITPMFDAKGGRG